MYLLIGKIDVFVVEEGVNEVEDDGESNFENKSVDVVEK